MRRLGKQTTSGLVDGVSDADDSSIQAFIQRFISERLKRSALVNPLLIDVNPAKRARSPVRGHGQ